MKVVELFAGIGSQRKALNNLKIDYDIKNIAEWYIPAILAYDSIHHGRRSKKALLEKDIEEIREYLKKYTFSLDSKKPISTKNLLNNNDDFLRNLYVANKRSKNLVSIDKVKGEELPDDIDVITYSFPCQDLSNVGAFHGYRDGIDRNKNSRSGLLWEVERLLLERENKKLNMPKILLMENVSTLLSSRHKKNFYEWKRNLRKMGYISRYYKMNSKDYGIPQNRLRVFMVSIYVRESDLSWEKLTHIKRLLENDFDEQPLRPLENFLRVNYTEKYLKEAKAAQPKDTPSRRYIYNKNYYLWGNKRERVEFCPTITTRQDRHPNSGVIEFETEVNNFRFLTAREVFLLMGFEERDYEKIEKSNFFRNKSSLFFTRDKYYILAGNSIVVNVLEEIFKKIEKIHSFLWEEGM